MRFHEFGNKNQTTVMLIHGLGTTWEKSFGKVIPLLTPYYYVVAVGLNGHNPEEKSDYINGEKEAEQVEKYIQNNLDGKIDVIYASSLGCITALLTAYRRNVTVRNIILDGTADMSLGLFNKSASKVAGWFGEKIITGKMNWFLKVGGITPEMLQTFLYPGISRMTMKNAFYDAASMFNQIDKMEPFKAVRVACWYGSKEKLAARGAKKIRKTFPNGKDTLFEGFGHGEILLHPEQFCKEMKRFLNGSPISPP